MQSAHNAYRSKQASATVLFVQKIVYEEHAMNWDIVAGNWKQLKGNVKEQWGKLTDDHLDAIAGKRDQLAGKIQETYGVSKDEANKQIEDWEYRNREDQRYF
jgi:uncharacterized protein YjbJ (UPF0337 family)